MGPSEMILPSLRRARIAGRSVSGRYINSDIRQPRSRRHHRF